MQLMKYLKIPQLSEQDVARFWRFVAKREVDVCWPWLAGKSDEGYGRFKLDGRLYSATRVGYFIARGEDPAPRHVCHTCDNPRCCNPVHFWLGSSSQNVYDSVRKGRYHRKDSAVRGEEVLNVQYTDTQIMRLRKFAQTLSVPEAARLSGVNVGTAYGIVHGDTWVHLPVLSHVCRIGQCRA